LRTDEAGWFHFTTLKPWPVSGCGNARQAPHFAILARGLLKGLATRAYFAGDPLNENRPAGVIDRRPDTPRHPAPPTRWWGSLAGEWIAVCSAVRTVRRRPFFSISEDSVQKVQQIRLSVSR
jgi:hypothetical protein